MTLYTMFDYVQTDNIWLRIYFDSDNTFIEGQSDFLPNVLNDEYLDKIVKTIGVFKTGLSTDFPTLSIHVQ